MIPIGCSKSITALGAVYLRVHYSADPGKDAAWAAEERAKSPRREWEREMEMNENVFDGEPVFADYEDSIHCPLDARAAPLQSRSLYVGGWDAGQTLSPAFVLLQVAPRACGYQISCLLEVVPPGPEPMETFAPRVGRALTQRLPGLWDEIEHWGDHTLVQRSGGDGRTAQLIAWQHGFRIKEASNEWNPRYSAVTWLLQRRIDETTAGFLIDGLNCPVLREGFLGAYRYEESPRSDGAGAGRILAMPLKNAYSHVQDALQYAAMRVQRLVQQRVSGSRKVFA